MPLNRVRQRHRRRVREERDRQDGDAAQVEEVRGQRGRQLLGRRRQDVRPAALQPQGRDERDPVYE